MNIIIVGGGTSGLLSGLALEKEGHNVKIFEKNIVGGLCRSEKINNYTMDIGVHAITMLNNGPLIRLLYKYSNYIPNFKPYGDYYVRDNNKIVPIPVSMQEITTTPIIPKKDKILITTKIIDLMTSGFSKDISAYEIVKDINISKKSYDFFNTICYFLSGEDAKQTPLWRLFTGANYIPEDDIIPFIYNDLKINPLKISVFKKFNKNNMKNILNDGFVSSIKKSSKKYINKFINRERFHSQGYPVGGVQSILNCILNSMEKTKIYNEEVIKIEEVNEKEGKYCITTKNNKNNNNSNNNSNNTNTNKYYCDIVIYSAPSKYLPDITNIEEINNIRDRLKNIKHTTSLTVWIGHKDNPLNYIGSEIWIDHPCWATCTSNYDKNLAPKDKHLLGFSFVNEKKENALNIIENKLNLNIDKADFIHYQQYIPEQASCVIGQFFVYPKIRDDFYVVGTDADPRSMGITRAAYSVETMLSEFNNSLKLNKK